MLVATVKVVAIGNVGYDVDYKGKAAIPNPADATHEQRNRCSRTVTGF